MLKKLILIITFFTMAVTAMDPGIATAQEMLGQGTFAGRSGHKISGSVSIVKTSEGYEVRLDSAFKLDGAPGPWLGFGNNGKYDKKTEFSKLGSNSGAQVYKVPGNIDVSKYKELYVWCRPFGVPLGVAKLN